MGKLCGRKKQSNGANDQRKGRRERMVILYTWAPDPAAPIAGHSPDLGHTSLQVDSVYASFWPQKDSLVGAIVSLLTHRTRRQPGSYPEEIQPENGFMQRPATHTDELTGLDEAKMLAQWEEVRNTDFDGNTHNCSHVARDLLAAGLPPEFGSRLPELCEKR